IPCSSESSRKNSACMRLPISRPCMSVNATTTVSIAPDSTSARSSSLVITRTSLVAGSSDEQAAYDRVRVEPEGIAERLWPGRVRAVDVLGGGITNRNFKIELAGGDVVVL